MDIDIPTYIWVAGGLIVFLIALYLFVPSKSNTPQQSVQPRMVQQPPPPPTIAEEFVNGTWSFSPSDEESGIPQHNVLMCKLVKPGRVHLIIRSEDSKGEFDLNMVADGSKLVFTNDEGETQFVINNNQTIELVQYDGVVCSMQKMKKEKNE